MRSRSLVTGALSALGLFAALPAEATISRFAELQVSSTSLRDLLNARFRESPSCPTSFACGASQCILDHVDFPNTGTFAVSGSDQKAVTPDITTTVSRVFYRQPMKIFTSTEVCATTAGCAPTVLNTTLSMRMFVQDKPGDATRKQLCADPTSASPVIPGFDPNQLPTVCDDLDFGGLSALVGDAYQLFGAELALSGNASRVGIRLEMGEPERLTNPPGILGEAYTALRTARRGEWNTFLGGTLAASQAGSQWSALFSDALLEGSLARRIGNSLAGRPELEITRNPSGDWSPIFGVDGAVNIDMAGRASVPVCPDVDIDPISFYMPLEVDAENNLITIDGIVDWDLSDWDVFVCGALGSFLGPSGLMIGEIVAAAIASGLTPSDFGEVAVPPECDYDGEHSIQCAFPLNLPIISTGAGSSFTTLDLAGATPVGDGLVVFGDALLTSRAPQNTIVTAQANISYGVHGSCSSMHTGYEGSITLSGGARICSTQITDPKGVYNVAPIANNSWANQTIALSFPNISSQYCPAATPNCAQTPYQQFLAAPYPLKVTVRTTGGIKTVSVPAPAMATAAQETAAMNNLILQKANCMARSTGLFGIPGLYDPRWDIDPPYDAGYPASRVVNGLSRAVGTVTISNPTIELLSVAADLGGRLGRGSQLLYRGTAVITSNRVTYRIPLNVQFSTTFGLTRSLDLRTQTLANSARVQARVDLSSGLPAALAGTAFTLDIPAGAARIIGTTR
jgi:hypothetical protein